MFDVMLTALIHRLAHLLPEPCRGDVRGIRRHQPPIEPSRAIGTNLLFQLNGRDDTDAGQPVATGIIGRGTALKVLPFRRSGAFPACGRTG